MIFCLSYRKYDDTAQQGKELIKLLSVNAEVHEAKASPELTNIHNLIDFAVQSAYQKYQDLSSSAITIVSNYDSSIEPIEIVVEDIKSIYQYY